jgi:peptide/nickel transport system permease protein
LPKLPRSLKALLRNPTGIVGLAILVPLIAVVLAGGLIAPTSPFEMVAQPLLWPGQNAVYPLGTDALGRDLVSGLIYGGRVSLTIALASTAISLIIGITIGALGGYFGGWIDDALNRVTAFFQTIPPFLFLIVLVAVLQPTLSTIVMSIAIVSWPTIARIVRAEFRSQKEREYVLAARSLGYSQARIIVQEILPNAIAPVIITTSVIVATAILNESALSFLGLGDPNVISWGSMIGAGRQMLRTGWYLTALPGVAILLTVLALNLLGEAINDALNPRMVEDRS